MTTAASDSPRKQLGKVAEVHGLAADGPWITVREAFTLTGLKQGVLVRWEEEGIVSVLQHSEGAPRLYLKPEMEALAELGTDGPPNLRTVRRYVQAHAGGGKYRSMKRTKGDPQQDTPDSEPRTEAERTATLAAALREEGFTAELVGEHRVRVTKGPDSRPVEIACLRRVSAGNDLWFAWGGGIWMCEADNVTDAVLLVKAALRRIGAAR